MRLINMQVIEKSLIDGKLFIDQVASMWHRHDHQHVGTATPVGAAA
jgi:hypothetical protein